MSGRKLPVMLVDEFTASRLRHMIEAEMDRLKVQQNICRDNYRPLEWASIKIDIHGLDQVRSFLERGLSSLGEPDQEDKEDRLRNIERISYEMPRSKANDTAWRQAKAEQKAKREAFRSPSTRST